MEGKYLTGPLLQVTTKSLRTAEGKRVRYLTEADIDKSGRGYYFPREKEIMYVKNRQIVFTDYDSVMFSAIREMQLV